MKLVASAALRSGALWISLVVSALATGAITPDFTGRWEVTTTYPGGAFVAGLDLTSRDDEYEGKSGYLVPDCCWYHYAGTREKDGLHLQVLGPDSKSEIGKLVLTS